jgi:hypothetical protein
VLKARFCGVVVGALALALLAGCGSGDDAAVTTLAKVDGWRDGLDDASIPAFAVLELAYDDADARALWDAAVPDGLPAASGDPVGVGIYGDLAEVDLTTHVVGLWSSGQSGSCPNWLDSVETRDGEVALVAVEDLQGGDACTDDYNAYSQVVVLARNQVPPADALPLDGRLTSATVIDGAVRTGDSTLRVHVTEFAG